MANLSFKANTVAKFDALTSKTAGALYFATDSKETVSGTDRNRAYLYYDDGTNKYNIVPRMLGIKNGGTGLDMSTKTANALVILNSSVNGMTTIASKAGAFFSTGTNVLPKYGTLPVEYGGTECTTLTDGALLIGAGQSPIEFVTDVAKGSVLMSNGVSTNPVYGVMDMRWQSGTTSGPKFVYITNGVESTKDEYIIPAANGNSASGIVTTTTQTFGGEKTFTSTMNTSIILPIKNCTYDLGSSTKIWNTIHHIYSYWYDANSKRNANTSYTSGGASATEGTYGTQGYFNLYLGNGTARSTTLNQGAGNSKGRLYLFGSGAGYSMLQAANSSGTSYTVNIPAADGNMLISTGESTSGATGVYIPFSSSLNNTVKYNYALHFNHTAGTSSTTGSSEFVVGVKTQTKNSLAYYNAKGILTLYTGAAGYIQIMPGATQTDATVLYLPNATGQLVYHTNDTAVGSGTKPVYVSAAGKVTVSGSTVGSNTAVSASGKTDGSFKPMYLNSGTFTAASTTIGSTALPIYMNAGVLTQCSGGDIFSNFSSTAGTSGETLSITVSGQNRTVTLDAANTSQGGVVTTGAQTFGGAKTFNDTTDSTSTSTGSVIVKGGLGVAKQLRVGSTATFSGVVNAYGGSVKIGTSGESATLSYDTSTDTLTISFP